MSFDFDAAVQAPFRMQPGLRRLGPGATQLTPSVVPHRGAARHLREKLAVLWAYPWQALLVQPGFDAGPALAALAGHAATEHPGALRVDGPDWVAPWLGWRLDADDRPVQVHGGWPEIGSFLAQLPAPWRRAALISLVFAEDFAIVDARDGTIPWLAVALPSVWAPEEKIGRHFAEVHAPVADNRLVVNASEHLVRLVTGTDRWERFVWNLTAHPRLHAHPQRVDPARWAPGLEGDALAAQTWWRTERQTFIPVPGARQAVFTIGVDTQPLPQALDTPQRAARVHDAVASMSEAVLGYRGLTAVREPLLRWLAQRASAAAPSP
ncbi:heme-dependent oxidative N-demethylase subunit alpha family protein [Ideonella sp. A 288]|uniref:heme-dependent oxidative N-demethylase subunit alpha family protein n=1 Tax=Ideonella sp. A 288 TaxID=1962181 RepID=UPI001185F642|nr:heme-dependent oxidative N-demethylase subunit alpha family protein [Ideonella sp. A 288]